MKKILLINDYAKKGGAEVIYRNYAELMSKDGYYVEVFDSTKQSITRSPFSYIFSMESIFKLHKVIRDFQPDIIWLHNYNQVISPSVLYLLKLRKKSLGFKVFYTAHDFHLVSPSSSLFSINEGNVVCLHESADFFSKARDSRGLFYTLLKKVQWLVAYRHMRLQEVIDRIFCPSSFIADVLRGSCVGVDNIYLLRNPMLASGLTDKEVSNGSRTSLRLLFVGRLAPEKGLVEFIGDASGLPRGLIEDFTIVGAGPEEKNIRRAVQRARPNFDVNFLGEMSNEEVYIEIQNTDLMVLPSMWFENAPVTIVEAAMNSKLILLNQIGSLPSFGRDVGNAVFYQAGDPVSLDAALRSSMSLNKFTVRLEQFSPESFSRSLKEIFENE